MKNLREEAILKRGLFAILKNKIADYLRHKYKVSNNYQLVDPIATYFGKNKRWKKLDEPKNWNFNEEELFDNVEFIAVFKTCFDNLPEKWSTAVKLKYLYTTNSKDICENLGITLSNFWQIVHRAKLQLRKCFEINWFDNKETRR